jgi:glycosyltransferase involved in cell wall biosynthesis
MDVAVNAWFWNQPHTGSGQYLRQLLPALAALAPDNIVRPVMPNDTAALPTGRLVPHTPTSQSGEFEKRLQSMSSALYKVYFEQRIFPAAAGDLGASIAHVPYHAAPVWHDTPTVVTVHDLIPMAVDGYRASPLIRAYVQLVAVGAQRAEAIITDSEASRRDILHYLNVDPHRLHVVPLAPAPHFRTVEPREALARYSLPQHYILYLGGFDRRKNVTRLIQAFARLVEDELIDDSVHLVLAGRLPTRNTEFTPDPQRIVAQLDLDARVIFPGWIAEADKPAIYSGAFAFVFPSMYEGFGLPVVEAMACNVPVITSNAASLPEIVGDAGMTVDPLSVRALSEALALIVNDSQLRQHMAEASGDRASQFSWTRTAQATLDVFATVPEQQAMMHTRP